MTPNVHDEGRALLLRASLSIVLLGSMHILAHYVASTLAPLARLKLLPTELSIPSLAIEREQVKRIHSRFSGVVLNSRAKCLSDSAASILLDDENAAEPRLQILATMKIVSAKGGGAEDFRLGVSYPSDRKGVAIHVPAKDSDP